MAKTLLIYGSLTGNTEGVAHKIQELLHSKNKEIEVKNAADANPEDLNGAYTTFILASSTWDDGLPQADFADFIERVKGSTLNLSAKKVAILGCGDSNYVHFCGATEVIEQTFISELGGQKIIENLRIDGYPEMEENQKAISAWVEKLANLID